MIASLTIICLSVAIVPNQSYSSYVDTFEDSYFKVLDLESEVTYNFTISLSYSDQMDFGFSIHLDERPREKNALVTVDNPGQNGETTLFIPETSADYYIRAFSNYEWGFIEVTVKEQTSGEEKIVEPYYVPFNWQWVWIPAVVIIGLVIFLASVGIFVNLMRKIRWEDIKWPRIEIDELGVNWNRKRERRKSQRAQRIARRNYLRKNRQETRKLQRLKRKTRQKEMQIEKDGVSIIKISDTTARCMVSGLEIKYEREEVVACPHCKNVSKKPMLTEWLKVKGSCPICRTEIIIDDCLPVRYSI